MRLCYICQQREAIHKNSHLIPSFLTAKIFNPDNVNKRDKALSFTILDREVKVSTKGLTDVDYERIFENLPNEDRIKNELIIEAGTVPFIFCVKCENDISKYIETPYAQASSQNLEIDGHLGVAFWSSVIWRLAISNSYEQTWVKGLPNEFISLLGKIVQQYICCKNNGSVFNMESIPFYYKLIRGRDIDCDFIYGIPNPQSGEYLLYIGSIAILYKFVMPNGNPNRFFEKIKLFFKKCKKNTGNEKEEILNLENDEYAEFRNILFNHAVVEKKNEDCIFLEELWTKLGLPGICPEEVKSEFFKRIYSDTIKIGDRHTFENKKKVLSEIFIDLGLIKD